MIEPWLTTPTGSTAVAGGVVAGVVVAGAVVVTTPVVVDSASEVESHAAALINSAAIDAIRTNQAGAMLRSWHEWMMKP